MAKEIKVGPLLGVESDTQYTICFLAKNGLDDLKVICDGQTVDAVEIAKTASGRFWRAVVDLPVPAVSRTVTYSVISDAHNCSDMFLRQEWSFYLPQKGEAVRIAYASCNGFTKDPGRGGDHYVLWERMQEAHESRPYSLLVMGGDQLYADEIWQSPLCETVGDWSEERTSQRIKAKATQRMKKELGVFYESLYLRHWRKKTMSMMMASVPSVMMWDDHDVIDGWGSFSEELQECEVFQAIYVEASRHFELFQMRSRNNSTLLGRGTKHYSFALTYRGYGILGLDNRSERSLTQVMSRQNWSDVKGWLDGHMPGEIDSLLVMSAVPVVYRSFAGVEAIMGATPWQESLEDDVNDHWTADRHEGEREKLITILLDFKNRAQPVNGNEGRIVILSGDVHVGSLGVIDDLRNPQSPRQIHQVVASGIVHPPVGWFTWKGLKLITGDRRERLEHSEVYTENVRPLGGSKFIRSRNYANLEQGTDGKLWVEWVCEDKRRREFGIPVS